MNRNQKVQKRVLLSLGLGLGALLGALGGYYGYQGVMNHSRVWTLKLADCTNSTLRINFVAPKALALDIVMGIPEMNSMSSEMTNKPPYTFAGHVTVLERGHSVFEFEIDSERAEVCNWLVAEHQVPVGFILTNYLYDKPQIGWPGLVKRLQPFHNYQLLICFSKAPPVSAGLFFSVLQKHGEYQKRQRAEQLSKL